ncbi:MAG: VOC family protein [Chitinophagales bacterium]|nr:VOC family protein [Chitinophagales bacterium]
MRQQLSIITLGVDDLHRSLNFYEQGLGWKRSAASNDNICFFPAGGIVLALYPRVLLAEDAMVDAAGSGFTGITIAYNATSASEVDEVMKQVASLGATIVKPAQKVFWGGYSGYFKDPDGHLFEVAFNPFWEMDQQGNLMLP